MAAAQIERVTPPAHADERAMLENWLDFHRETLALKCAGLDDDQLRRTSASSSSMTLLGLVQHMAGVERNWFQRKFAGQDSPAVYEDAGQDGFALSPDRGIDVVVSAWRAEIARGREIIEAASLEDSGTPSAAVAHLGGDEISLRWILVHLIGEYARHNGHADLIREEIDGETGI